MVYGCRHRSLRYRLNRFAALVLDVLHAARRTCALDEVMLPEHRVVAVDPWNLAAHQVRRFGDRPWPAPPSSHESPYYGVPATIPPASINHIRFTEATVSLARIGKRLPLTKLDR